MKARRERKKGGRERGRREKGRGGERERQRTNVLIQNVHFMYVMAINFPYCMTGSRKEKYSAMVGNTVES